MWAHQFRESFREASAHIQISTKAREQINNSNLQRRIDDNNMLTHSYSYKQCSVLIKALSYLLQKKNKNSICCCLIKQFQQRYLGIKKVTSLASNPIDCGIIGNRVCT